ncbi:MAG: DNA primase [Acetobacter sp. 46_36]|jgi:DNA primase|nr:DNA primase [Acetobacter sp.]OLA64588.1 MAG: DNA primase [Acetobacter sp. 46_36]
MANDDLQRFIDELRARVSIADVVGAKVKLTKKGREYQGLCPFHNEKTPSFTVNESKGFYHCFGCGAHGDIIKFEMEANGLPFIDALQKLAHQAGLQMPQLSAKDKKEEDERKSLYEIMETACAFFERELRMPDGASGLKYFTEKRGLSPETLKKFRLGFAPNNNALMAHLKAQGIDEKDMKELGLIAIPEDTSRRPHDFFRNRVMIPITNKQGKIIAFGGRVMEKIEPKYLNSPDTPIFNKRRNLYNLDKAREVAYKEKKLIICEGYMDVIALDRYGFGYAVAPLGTALTEEQIAEAWRVCPEPILCLDGDSPGVKAAMRAVDRVLPMLKAGYSLQFLFLPDNQDPDEYLQAHGHDSFAALMRKTSPLIDILWRKYTENEDSSTPEKKALIEKTLLSEVAKIGDATVRSYYAQEIRSRIYAAFRRTPWQQPAAPVPPAPRMPVPPTSKMPETPPAYLDDIPLPEAAPQHRKPQPDRPSQAPRQFTNTGSPSNSGPFPDTASFSSFRPSFNAVPLSGRRPFSNSASSPDARSFPNSGRGASRWADTRTLRPALSHGIAAAPETLRQSADGECDKNLRFIIAAGLVYPELIDEYEEQVLSSDIRNAGLKNLFAAMADLYREAETPPAADELQQQLAQRPEGAPLASLWELDMLKKRSPFINDLRKNIDKLLLEDKLRTLEEEIKNVSAELCKNFTEEAYLRQSSLKKERDEILAAAAEPED